MKKRMYRATDVKKVDVQRLAERVQGQRITLGTDVAKEVQYGAVLDENKNVVQILKWNQLRDSRRLVRLLQELPVASLEVALEPSGTYGDPLRALLAASEIPVYRVSPKRCKDYSEVFDGVPSQHDGKSAVLVARLHVDGMSERWLERDELQRALCAAVSEAALHHGQLRANLNRLEAQLGRHWPEVTQELDLNSATLLDLLASYGDPRAVASAGEEAAARMRRVGGFFLKEKKISGVLRSAGDTIGVPMVEGERRLVQEIAREAQRNRQQLKLVEKRIEELAADEPSVRATAPDFGLLTAVVLLVKGGDPRMAPNTGSYIKSLGLNLKERSSGRYQGQLRITKRGSGTARQWLYMAVLRLIERDAVVKAWYRQKVIRA